MIDQATIQRVFDAADIVDVVSDYVTLQRRGVNYIGLCPFHNEKTPSFTVSPAKNICKCFGCGKGGNPVNFIMELENLSYIEAIKFLAKKYHIEIEEKELTPEQAQLNNERESLLALSEWASKHFSDNLKNNIEGKSVGLSYFLHRGFREDIIKKFQLGYAVDKRDYYTQMAQKSGFKLEFLEKSGLTIVKENNYLIDRFHGRAIFPIHSISGKVIAFGGRAIRKDEQVKYQNSPESEIYHKSQALYGLFFAKNAIIREQKCFIVEGYADVISMVQAGVENVVAPCGTALTVEQIRLLKRILPSVGADTENGNKNVTMLYDGDSAGMNAALKNGKLLLEEGLNVKVVVLPEGEDPDTFAQSHNANEVADYLKNNEVDYILFKINHSLPLVANDPIRKSQLIADLAATIAVIPDMIKRSVYIKECASILETDEKVFYSHANKVRKEKADKEIERRRREEQQGAALGGVDGKPAAENLAVPNPPAGQETAVPAVKSGRFDLEELNILKYVVRYGNCVLCEIQNEDESSDLPNKMTVSEYVVNDLKNDGMEFFNPLHKRILDEVEVHLGDAGFRADRFFGSYPDPQVSALVMDLLAEQYQLSYIHFNMAKYEPAKELEETPAPALKKSENKSAEQLEEEERIRKEEAEKELRERQLRYAELAAQEAQEEIVSRLFELVPHVVMDFKYKVVEAKTNSLRAKLKSEKDVEKIMELMQELAKWQEVHKVLSKKLGERIVVRL